MHLCARFTTAVSVPENWHPPGIPTVPFQAWQDLRPLHRSSRTCPALKTLIVSTTSAWSSQLHCTQANFAGVFRLAATTSRTSSTGIVRQHNHQPATLPCQLVFQLPAKLELPLVDDGVVQAAFGSDVFARLFGTALSAFAHVAHLQIVDDHHRACFWLMAVVALCRLLFEARQRYKEIAIA